MLLADTTRRVRKWVFLITLVGGLAALNLATLVLGEFYDTMSQGAWGILSQFSDVAAQNRPKSRSELEADARKARVESDKARFEAEKMHAQIEATEAEKRRMELDLKRGERRIASLEADAARVKQNNRRISETVKSMRDRIVKSIRRDASGEFVEMIPLLGDAFFIGSIAYDLNDACRQFQDLKALELYLSGSEGSAASDEAICLQSYGQMVSLLTGEDPGYAACVKDRLETRNLNPPSCSRYDDALPMLRDNADDQKSEIPDLPIIQ